MSCCGRCFHRRLLRRVAARPCRSLGPGRLAAVVSTTGLSDGQYSRVESVSGQACTVCQLRVADFETSYPEIGLKRAGKPSSRVGHSYS